MSLTESAPATYDVGGIKLVNGRVDYTDHFVRPNYSAALTELNGSLGAFSSTSRDISQLTQSPSRRAAYALPPTSPACAPPATGASWLGNP